VRANRYVARDVIERVEKLELSFWVSQFKC